MAAFGSWDDVTRTVAQALREAENGTAINLHAPHRPAPPDAPRRGLFRTKPPLPIAIYVQYLVFDSDITAECVGNAGPRLTALQEQRLTDLGLAAPMSVGHSMENWSRVYERQQYQAAAEIGVAALQILQANPGELRLETSGGS